MVLLSISYIRLNCVHPNNHCIELIHCLVYEILNVCILSYQFSLLRKQNMYRALDTNKIIGEPVYFHIMFNSDADTQNYEVYYKGAVIDNLI